MLRSICYLYIYIQVCTRIYSSARKTLEDSREKRYNPICHEGHERGGRKKLRAKTGVSKYFTCRFISPTRSSRTECGPYGTAALHRRDDIFIALSDRLRVTAAVQPTRTDARKPFFARLEDVHAVCI